MKSFLPCGIAWFTLAAVLASSASGFEINKVKTAPALTRLDALVGGRTVGLNGGAMYLFQWPGVYFRAAFKGNEVFFKTGSGRAIYHVIVDDQPGDSNVKWTTPGPGLYHLSGLSDGPHQIRIELATECQGGAVEFGGLYVRQPADALTVSPLPRQIEFIGDSHTVGYGNTSTKRQCTPEEIWSHTDTSQAFGPMVAKHFDSEYRINAISGRGIVRNYNGSPGDTLPEAYPYALFDRRHPTDDRGWNPQVIVIGLGTNDFSTPLHAGEKWKTRDEEHADYERTYVAFVESLRARHPDTFFILVANDQANGEIEAEVHRVIRELAARGEKRVGYAEFDQLELTGCDWHPSLADHRKMAAVLIRAIDEVLASPKPEGAAGH